MPPAKKPTPSSPRTRAAFKEPAALNRLNRSLDAAQEALAELRKDTGRDVGHGARDLYKDLRLPHTLLLLAAATATRHGSGLQAGIAVHHRARPRRSHPLGNVHCLGGGAARREVARRHGLPGRHDRRRSPGSARFRPRSAVRHVLPGAREGSRW